ncbi:MAG: hypothetical protein PHT78_10265 [Desulfitobacteriaceae bacterium]|nr:hypothetical protein [Desulfitobacteriaceae bacterium]
MGMIIADFTPKELGEAHRAILSLRNKSEKASSKLKEGSWQKTLLDSYVKAADIALKLIDGDTGRPFECEALNEANKSLGDALNRAEKVIGKFVVGSSQHTLQKNRIAALKIALTLIEKEQRLCQNPNCR